MVTAGIADTSGTVFCALGCAEGWTTGAGVSWAGLSLLKGSGDDEAGSEAAGSGGGVGGETGGDGGTDACTGGVFVATTGASVVLDCKSDEVGVVWVVGVACVVC